MHRYTTVRAIDLRKGDELECTDGSTFILEGDSTTDGSNAVLPFFRLMEDRLERQKCEAEREFFVRNLQLPVVVPADVADKLDMLQAAGVDVRSLSARQHSESRGLLKEWEEIDRYAHDPGIGFCFTEVYRRGWTK